MKLSWIIFLAVLLSSCVSTGPILAPAKQTYSQPTRHESELIIRATNYHEKKQYSKAIDIYQSIIKTNPHNATALYELALTYFVKGDFLDSLKYSRLAADIKSPFLANVYLLIGLNYARINQPEQAMRVYSFATRQFDNSIDLHYQLATTYLTLAQPGEAAEEFKKVIQLDPYHKDSHFQLGMAYYIHDYKSPAFLSLMTFLLLEPDSVRSRIAISQLDDIFRSGVVIDEKTNEISLEVNPNPKTDEGDFSLIDTVMATRRIELLLESKTNEMSIRLEQLKSYLLTSTQIKAGKRHRYFIERHYMPFYHSVYKENLTDALLYYTHRLSGNSGVSRWLGKHKVKVKQLKTKFYNFDWKTEL
jgi:tetratricopeptide (TPR) repeat protein